MAFASRASNLVVGDTNDKVDIFVRDRLSGSTERVSLGSAGEEGNGACASPSISADGRYVAFVSGATNLVAGDTNEKADVFVRDRLSGTTERVSVSSAEAQANDLTESCSISADGHFVAFSSWAGNLLGPGGDANGSIDVFVRHRENGTTERVSRSSAGKEGLGHSRYPSISADGGYVAFYSDAINLVVPKTNTSGHVFVRDRQSGTTELVSVSSAGTQGNMTSDSASISADGRYVAFRGDATNLLPDGADSNLKGDVFVRDRLSATTERVSLSSAGAQADGVSDSPSISADGRFVAFRSNAPNLKPGDTNSAQDIFVHDRFSGTTVRASVNSAGTQGNFSSQFPSISADGRYVAFRSLASNFVPAQDGGDTNGTWDIFVRLLFRR